MSKRDGIFTSFQKVSNGVTSFGNEVISWPEPITSDEDIRRIEQIIQRVRRYEKVTLLSWHRMESNWRE